MKRLKNWLRYRKYRVRATGRFMMYGMPLEDGNNMILFEVKSRHPKPHYVIAESLQEIRDRSSSSIQSIEPICWERDIIRVEAMS